MSPYISNNDYQNLIKTSFLADVRSNRLLSVESILEIDLLPPSPHSSEAAAPSAWPRDEVADAVAENSGDNYTCVATGNSIGQVRGYNNVDFGVKRCAQNCVMVTVRA